VYISTILLGCANLSHPKKLEEETKNKSSHDLREKRHVQVNEDKLRSVQGIVVDCNNPNFPTCLELSALLEDYIDIPKSSSVTTNQEKPHTMERDLLGSKGLKNMQVMERIKILSSPSSFKSLDFEDKFEISDFMFEDEVISGEKITNLKDAMEEEEPLV
ncbi:hypothetical protein KI387_002378, partial [Taxus chinensis]